MKKLKIIVNLLFSLIEDFFIIAGLMLIVKTTYGINNVIGNYLLGLILLAIGILLSKKEVRPPKI